MKYLNPSAFMWLTIEDDVFVTLSAFLCFVLPKLMVCSLFRDLILDKDMSLRCYQQASFEGLGGYHISVLSQSLGEIKT